MLAVLLKLVPPVGPLQALQLKIPTPPVERLFMASFNRATVQFTDALNAEATKTLQLPDKNYDTGDFTPAGVYRLNDDIHAFWLHKLAAKKFSGITPEIKSELLDFYHNPDASYNTRKKPEEWRQTLSELAILRQ